MNPLTVTWAPNMYTDWGWSNFQAWIHSGMDNYLMTPNGRTHRLLTRLAVDKLLHPFQPFILGQKCFAPKMAIKFGIPLIFYGEQEAEYGTPVNEAMSSKRDWTFSSIQERDEMYFGGISYESLKKDLESIKHKCKFFKKKKIFNLNLDFLFSVGGYGTLLR